MAKRTGARARTSEPKSHDREPEDGESRSREIWKGTLSFGLVEIPVGLVSAEDVKEEVRLSYLDRRDFSPVGYTRYNKTTNADVPWSEIVHGFEYQKGEHVAAVGVRGPALTLQLLRFAAELRSPNEVARVGRGAKEVGVTAREQEMAERLVEDMTGKWNPERFRDEYAADLKRMIDKKIASGKVHAMASRPARETRRTRGDVIDLMPLLKRSVEAARSGARDRRSRGGARSA